MSATEFWEGDPRLVVAYREAAMIERDNMNARDWRQGAYILEALLSASRFFREFGGGLEHEYPSEPWPLSAGAKAEADRRREKRDMELIKARFEAVAAGINQKLQTQSSGE